MQNSCFQHPVQHFSSDQNLGLFGLSERNVEQDDSGTNRLLGFDLKAPGNQSGKKIKGCVGYQ